MQLDNALHHAGQDIDHKEGWTQNSTLRHISFDSTHVGFCPVADHRLYLVGEESPEPMGKP